MTSLAGLRALSLYQPYASAVALGVKRYETRDWPTPYRGPLLVCSTASSPMGPLSLYKPACIVLAAHRPDWGYVLPHGFALCMVDVVDCRPADDVARSLRERAACNGDGAREALAELNLGDYSRGPKGKGRFAWRLDNLRRLSRAIPVKGLQKLWTPSAEIVAEVERQLVEAGA